MRLFFWVLAMALWLSSSQSFAQIDPNERRFHAQERLRLHKNGIENQWQVMVRADDAAELYQILNRLVGDYPDMEITRIWEHALKGFLAIMPLEDARRLAQDPHIRLVEQDSIIPKTPMVQKALIKEDSGTKDPPPGDAPCFCKFHQITRNDLPHGVGTQTIAWPNHAQNNPDLLNDCPGGPDCLDNWGLDRIDQRALPLDGQFTPRYEPYNEKHPVRIYLLDSGIKASHVEFTDEKGNSRILPGYNATGDDNGTADFSSSSHGTHVAAIAGGRTFGVSKKAKLVPVRIHGDGFFGPSVIVTAADWIVANHPDGHPGVVNLSANGASYVGHTNLSWAMRSLEEMGFVIVNSAGNHGAGVTHSANMQASDESLVNGAYPKSVIVVGASASNDTRFVYPTCTYRNCDTDTGDGSDNSVINDCGSNVGAAITLFAPGENIVSAARTGNKDICILSGTSMAAPHVSGAAALLLANYPNIGPATVKKALKRAATRDQLTDHHDSPNLLLFTHFRSHWTRPVAGDNFYRMSADQEKLVISPSELIADDLAWNDGAKTLSWIGNAARGTVAYNNDGNIEFTANKGFFSDVGEPIYAQFSYRVMVGAEEDTGKVRIYVESPYGLADYRTWANLNSDVSNQINNLSFIPDGGELVRVEKGPDFDGTLSLNDEGKIVYTSGNRTNIDRIKYTVRRSDGVENTAEIAVYVHHPTYPPPPSNLSWSPSSQTGTVCVTWNPSPLNDVTHYTVTQYKSGGETCTFGPIYATEYIATNLSNGTYSYTVTAHTSEGKSDPLRANPWISNAIITIDSNTSFVPTRGQYFNPNRDGVGIDIQRIGSNWQVAWTTYRDSNGTPVWYMSDPAPLAENNVSDRPAVIESAFNEYRLVNGVAEKTQIGWMKLEFSTDSDGDPNGEAIFKWETFAGTPGVTLGDETIQFLAGGDPELTVTGWWQDMDDTEKEWYYHFAHQKRITGGVLFYRPDGSPTWVINGDTSPWYQPIATGDLIYHRMAHQAPSNGPGLEAAGPPPVYAGNFTMAFPNQNPSAGAGTIDLNIVVPGAVDPEFPEGFSWSASGPVKRVELTNGQDCNQ